MIIAVPGICHPSLALREPSLLPLQDPDSSSMTNISNIASTLQGKPHLKTSPQGPISTGSHVNVSYISLSIRTRSNSHSCWSLIFPLANFFSGKSISHGLSLSLGHTEMEFLKSQVAIMGREAVPSGYLSTLQSSHT